MCIIQVPAAPSMRGFAMRFRPAPLETLAIIALAVFAAPAAFATEAADIDAARKAVLAVFDKPDAPLHVDPIAADGGYAVADWLQGSMGGRALLRETASGWRIVLCAGMALKSSVELQKIGLPKSAADAISERLSNREKAVEPAKLEQIDRFDGVVRMDSDDHNHQDK